MHDIHLPKYLLVVNFMHKFNENREFFELIY